MPPGNTGRAGFAILAAILSVSSVRRPALAGERDGQGRLQSSRALLSGVNRIGVPGWPGIVCAFGPEAFPLAVGANNRRLAPVVAATRFGSGRAVMFGHDGYTSGGILNSDDSGRLMVNAVRWVAGGAASKEGGPRVAVRRQKDLKAYLSGQGFDVAALDGDNWRGALADCDVFCIDPARLGGGGDIRALQDFVRRGGGLVAAGTGWGWAQIHRKPIREYPGNRLLGPAGLVQANSGAGATEGGRIAIRNPPPEFCQATWALEKLLAQSRGEVALDKTQAAQAVFTLTMTLKSLPPDDRLLLPRLRELAAETGETAFPTPGKPLKQSEDGLACLMVVVKNREMRSLPPEKITAHPAAKGFPYEVPEGAERVTGTLSVDTKVPDWHSTGLYAAPGDLVEVTVPAQAAAVSDKRKCLAVRIGCHTDHIWHHDSWQRWPELSYRRPLAGRVTRIANPFGGSIYIEVPKKCGHVVGHPSEGLALRGLGIVPVTIANAVRAPHYVLGETDLDRWRRSIRRYPAPWAELECPGIILTVPSRVLRDLDDPEGLMRCWNRVVELQDELAQYEPGYRKRPERMVCDQQISAGYMHSGYPVMTGLDVAGANVSREKLFPAWRGQRRGPDFAEKRAAGWGQWHELGHNHQSGDWTFGGTVEVTVNLFTLYVLNKLHGIETPEARPEVLSPRKRKGFIKAHLAGGAPFEKWKSDPFLALIMYVQLVEAFGWQPMKDVFAEYRRLPRHERPKTDDEKRDQWMVRYSRRVGRDLGPFFRKWGVPTSKAASYSIAHLPVWMSPDFDYRKTWKDGWRMLYCSSENPGDGWAFFAWDDDPETIWHSRWTGGVARPPHEIQLDLGREVEVTGFTYLPRQKGGINGTAREYEFYAAPAVVGVNAGAVPEGGRFLPPDAVWGEPVARGEFGGMLREPRRKRTVRFGRKVKARYVRFRILSAANGRPFGAAAELDILTTDTHTTRPASDSAAPTRWGSRSTGRVWPRN